MMQRKKRCVDCHHFRLQRKSKDWLLGYYPGSLCWRRKVDYEGYAIIMWCKQGKLPREYYIENGNIGKMQLECGVYYFDKK